MNGVLVVDKPAGPTSHDVVARVRRALGIPRVGHTGTLDPLATGVLPLVVGQATRLARFLTADDKEYVAGIRLGSATPTYDAEQRIAGHDDGGAIVLEPAAVAVTVAEADVAAALAPFRGTYRQSPPPFSAKKIAGTPAYLLARLQKAVAIEPVQVSVRELELIGCAGGLVTIRLVCSSGFYVRSLAHELGQRLGCGAHLETLRRTRAGEFTLAQAVPLAAIEAEGPGAATRLVPTRQLLTRLPHVVVNERGARRAAHGNTLAPDDLRDAARTAAALVPETPVRVLDDAGGLLAIGRATAGGLLQPVVVLV